MTFTLEDFKPSNKTLLSFSLPFIFSFPFLSVVILQTFSGITGSFYVFIVYIKCWYLPKLDSLSSDDHIMDLKAKGSILREKENQRERKESKERNECWTAERTLQPGTPAVKTSNHMRRAKRFLHGPLLHLVNFYSLVDCQALGSTKTFHATPWSRIKKTDGKKDCWWIQLSAFKGSVCFLDCVFVCEADDYVPPQIEAFIMKPHTGPAHGLASLSSVNHRPACTLVFLKRSHLNSNKGITVHC